MSKTTRVPEQACPTCGKKLDCASSLEANISPAVGDLTVCIECTALMVYEPGMMVRLAGKDELRQLPPDVLFQLVRTQTAIREMHRQRRRDNWAKN